MKFEPILLVIFLLIIQCDRTLPYHMKNIKTYQIGCECKSEIYMSPLKDYFAVKTCVMPFMSISLDLTKVGIYSKDSTLICSELIGEDNFNAHIYWKNDNTLIIGEIRELPFFPDTVIRKTLKESNSLNIYFEERLISFFIQKAILPLGTGRK